MRKHVARSVFAFIFVCGRKGEEKTSEMIACSCPVHFARGVIGLARLDPMRDRLRARALHANFICRLHFWPIFIFPF